MKSWRSHVAWLAFTRNLGEAWEKLVFTTKLLLSLRHRLHCVIAVMGGERLGWRGTGGTECCGTAAWHAAAVQVLAISCAVPRSRDGTWPIPKLALRRSSL